MGTLPPWCEDGEARRAFVRERTLIEERSALRAAKKEAYVETALKMIKANRFDDAAIAKFSGLPEDEVHQLRVQAVLILRPAPCRPLPLP